MTQEDMEKQAENNDAEQSVEPSETASEQVSEQQPQATEPVSDEARQPSSQPEEPQAAEPESTPDDEEGGQTDAVAEEPPEAEAEAVEEEPEDTDPEEPPEAEAEAKEEEPADTAPEEPPDAEAAAVEEEPEEPQPAPVDAEEASPPEEAAEEEAPAAHVYEERPNMKWYVIHAHSGHENKVKRSLENRVRQEQLEDCVNHILVPSEEVAEVKGGKKRITSRKIFPGYVLVQMELTHKTWYLVRTTPGVTGFIGSGKMPIPLEPGEIELIFEQMRGEQKKPKPKVAFEKDERVKIIEGPFANFMGSVDEVNVERGKLKVMVEIFERLTSVELEFWQVEKT